MSRRRAVAGGRRRCVHACGLRLDQQSFGHFTASGDGSLTGDSAPILRLPLYVGSRCTLCGFSPPQVMKPALDEECDTLNEAKCREFEAKMVELKGLMAQASTINEQIQSELLAVQNLKLDSMT